ncbi:MAG: VTC domain-containing protein [Anaerolineales bacterium]|nr:VTC domain-containing protein [Anaerolineales bacterium]
MARRDSASGNIQEYTRLRSFRYERKFLSEELLPRQVTAIVRSHPLMCRAPYPPRQINSLYLDTADMDNYNDNVSGAAQRRKVRLRWYGTMDGMIERPMLEFKVKYGLVGKKLSYPMAPFVLDEHFNRRVFQELADRSSLPETVRDDLRRLAPVLLNCYQRSYFAALEERFRITVDSQQVFWRIHGPFRNSLLHRQQNPRDVIVELKYAVGEEPQADRAAGYFPFRIMRNSKYVQGIERVYF